MRCAAKTVADGTSGWDADKNRDAGWAVLDRCTGCCPGGAAAVDQCYAEWLNGYVIAYPGGGEASSTV